MRPVDVGPDSPWRPGVRSVFPNRERTRADVELSRRALARRMADDAFRRRVREELSDRDLVAIGGDDLDRAHARTLAAAANCGRVLD